MTFVNEKQLRNLESRTVEEPCAGQKFSAQELVANLAKVGMPDSDCAELHESADLSDALFIASTRAGAKGYVTEILPIDGQFNCQNY